MPLLRGIGIAVSLGLAAALTTPAALADTVPYAGTFTADDTVFSVTLMPTTTQTYTFATTSYSNTALNGFFPELTLFNTATGANIGFSPTGVAGDAFLSETLGPGSYVLDLTEFPNVSNGNLAAGFLFAGDPTVTGDLCNVPGGKFIDTSTTACTQRTGAYVLNVTNASPIPEPPTWMLVLPGVGLGLLVKRSLT